MIEDEMVGRHHRLDGHESEQVPGVVNGQGGLVCFSPWSHKKSDTTEWLNWTELMSANDSASIQLCLYVLKKDICFKPPDQDYKNQFIFQNLDKIIYQMMMMESDFWVSSLQHHFTDCNKNASKQSSSRWAHLHSTALLLASNHIFTFYNFSWFIGGPPNWAVCWARLNFQVPKRKKK